MTRYRFNLRKAAYAYQGARYFVAAPPPTPADAIPAEQKQQICQYTQILVDGTQSIRDWLEQYGIQDTGLDTALDIYEEVNETSDKAVGGCAMKTSAVLRRTMARVAKELPPPTPEAQKGLEAVLAKIKATVDATEGVKRALVAIGLEGVEQLMNDAKQYMSELYKAIEMGGAAAISKFQAKQGV